jgi:hypothetical protein
MGSESQEVTATYWHRGVHADWGQHAKRGMNHLASFD